MAYEGEGGLDGSSWDEINSSLADFMEDLEEGLADVLERLRIDVSGRDLIEESEQLEIEAEEEIIDVKNRFLTELRLVMDDTIASISHRETSGGRRLSQCPSHQKLSRLVETAKWRGLDLVERALSKSQKIVRQDAFSSSSDGDSDVYDVDAEGWGDHVGGGEDNDGSDRVEDEDQRDIVHPNRDKDEVDAEERHKDAQNISHPATTATPTDQNHGRETSESTTRCAAGHVTDGAPSTMDRENIIHSTKRRIATVLNKAHLGLQQTLSKCTAEATYSLSLVERDTIAKAKWEGLALGEVTRGKLEDQRREIGKEIHAKVVSDVARVRAEFMEVLEVVEQESEEVWGDCMRSINGEASNCKDRLLREFGPVDGTISHMSKVYLYLAQELERVGEERANAIENERLQFLSEVKRHKHQLLSRVIVILTQTEANDGANLTPVRERAREEMEPTGKKHIGEQRFTPSHDSPPVGSGSSSKVQFDAKAATAVETAPPSGNVSLSSSDEALRREVANLKYVLGTTMKSIYNGGATPLKTDKLHQLKATLGRLQRGMERGTTEASIAQNNTTADDSMAPKVDLRIASQTSELMKQIASDLQRICEGREGELMQTSVQTSTVHRESSSGRRPIISTAVQAGVETSSSTTETSATAAPETGEKQTPTTAEKETPTTETETETETAATTATTTQIFPQSLQDDIESIKIMLQGLKGSIEKEVSENARGSGECESVPMKSSVDISASDGVEQVAGRDDDGDRVESDGLQRSTPEDVDDHHRGANTLDGVTMRSEVRGNSDAKESHEMKEVNALSTRIAVAETTATKPITLVEDNTDNMSSSESACSPVTPGKLNWLGLPMVEFVLPCPEDKDIRMRCRQMPEHRMRALQVSKARQDLSWLDKLREAFQKRTASN